MRRVLTPAEVQAMTAAMHDPEFVARMIEDARTAGHVEVDNPWRRETRPRRGTE